MKTYYDKTLLYEVEMRKCPKCGGRVVLVVGHVPTPWCEECGTVFRPDVPELVARWWNDGKE